MDVVAAPKCQTVLMFHTFYQIRHASAVHKYAKPATWEVPPAFHVIYSQIEFWSTLFVFVDMVITKTPLVSAKVYNCLKWECNRSC